MATPNLYAATTATPKTVATAIGATSATTVYTVSAGKAAMVAKALIVNVTATAVVVTFNLVPSGSTAGPANRVVSAFSLAPNDTMVMPELDGAFLGEGDLLSISAGTGAAVTVVLSVLELS